MEKPEIGILAERKGRMEDMNRIIHRIGGVLMFLVKLPFRILSLPVLALLIVVRVASLLVTGISSLVTNLIGMTALLAAAGIWMFQLGSDHDACMMLGFGLFLILAPRAADWIVDKATMLIAKITFLIIV